MKKRGKQHTSAVILFFSQGDNYPPSLDLGILKRIISLGLFSKLVFNNASLSPPRSVKYLVKDPSSETLTLPIKHLRSTLASKCEPMPS